MSTTINLATVYSFLSDFAGMDSFWQKFDTIFGATYDRPLAESLKTRWQNGDFSQLPSIQILSSDVLGNASGAYAISTNTIYLSDAFLAAASVDMIHAVILEEIGHFVDAQVNSTDTLGDEGKLFSAQVLGVELSEADLSLIRSQDDSGLITINDQSLAIEAHGDYRINYSPIVWINSISNISEGQTSIMSGSGRDNDQVYIAQHNLFNQPIGYSSYTDTSYISYFYWTIGSQFGGYTSSTSYQTNSSGSYGVQLIAVDNEGQSSSAYGTLFVANVAPSSVQLSAMSQSLNQGGSTSFSVSFYDPGYESNHTVFIDHDGDGSYSSYSLGAGGAGNRTFISPSFTYSTSGNYQARVYVTDSDGASSSMSTLPVYVNGAPTNLSLSATNINENVAANSVIGTFSSTDPNTGNTFTYSLVTGTGSTDNASFSISGNQLQINASPNFEAKSSYNVLVRTTDQGGLFFDKALTVNITDVNEFAVTTPTDSNATANSVAENAANGTLVGINANSSDADGTNNTITYSLTDNAGGRFAVDANTGVVSVANGSLLNYESATSHNITAQASSSDGSSKTQTFSIALTDVNEFAITTPTDSNVTTNSVAENAANGTLVNITANASDADGTNNTITYSLTNNAGGRFAIDANTGVVSVANGTLLDFESATSQSITVQASSSDNSTSSQTFNIAVTNVNEAPTVTSGATVSIPENTTGTVYTVTATDPDAATTLVYSLTGTDAAKFNINGSTGVVTFITAPDFEAPTDSGTDNVYNINAIATDAGGLTSTQAVEIAVTNTTTNIINSSTTNTDGNDTFSGTNEIDNINSGLLNDTIIATVGSLQSGDTFNGFTGTDTFVLSQGVVGSNLVINLASTNQFGALTGVTGITLNNFENVDISGFNGKGNITGNSLDNIITGGSSIDYLSGGGGNDTIFGNGGNDTIFGGTGDDTLDGGDGIDYLSGDDGNDSIFGGLGNDSIYGGAGNDSLTGGSGDDYLSGGLGADTFTGGVGNDSIWLGVDAVTDSVLYTVGDGLDTINNFVRGSGGDTISFTGIAAIDVVTFGSNTNFRIGNGVSGDSGFGSGALLSSILNVNGFVAGDVNVNLFNTSGVFSFS